MTLTLVTNYPKLLLNTDNRSKMGLRLINENNARNTTLTKLLRSLQMGTDNVSSLAKVLD